MESFTDMDRGKRVRERKRCLVQGGGKQRMRNEKGQDGMERGDGLQAHQFLKAKPSSAAESVKFTLLISCNNL